MKETIYLIANRSGIDRMRKTLSEFKKGEMPIKLTVTVDNKAFGVPTIEKSIYVEDWGRAVDVEDVQFEKHIITQEEAEIIKVKRIEKMKSNLESQGYTLNKKELEKGQ